MQITNTETQLFPLFFCIVNHGKGNLSIYTAICRETLTKETENYKNVEFGRVYSAKPVTYRIAEEFANLEIFDYCNAHMNLC